MNPGMFASQDRGEQPSRRAQRGYMGHLLRQVLMQDPLGCARKLVCQLSASTRGLRPHEVAILRLVQ